MSGRNQKDERFMIMSDDVSSNPWLTIPWEEYEGHMASPEVGQAQFLSLTFKGVLEEYRPKRVAVLGCSTGNGFEHLDPSVTKKVIGVDINPEYLAVLRARYASSIPGMTMIYADLTRLELDTGSCDLIYCGLVFEYVPPNKLIEKCARWLSFRGKLIVVLQLPSDKSEKVSDTKFKSLKRLEPFMRLVEPEVIQQASSELGLSEIKSYTQILASQKAFFVGHYAKVDG
jgi:ubiquinone/menaquinone biosynthesis C-methylase UbiE